MQERYSRQQLFTPIGLEGQQKINCKTVLIIGAGALGAASAESLVRAGIGKLVIVDRDYVEVSNLQRQQLYEERDATLRIPKAEAAKAHLQSINSAVTIESHVADADVELLSQLVLEADVLLDATDNFDTRMIINDIAQKYNTPWIYGACVGSYGISFTIIPGKTPCLNCLLETVPLGGATCDTVGIISPTVQMVVAHQVAEALKLLVEDEGALRQTVVSFDLWQHNYQSIHVQSAKQSACTSCGPDATYPYLHYDQQMKSAVLCGRDTVQLRPAPGNHKIDLNELSKRMASLGKVEQNPFLLSFQPYNMKERMVVFQDNRVLIHGTKDIHEAKKLYYQWIG
ncbi:MoeB/ThiF family adenylyltransferase [Pontibacillus litoralis]|uniref:Thiamine/molybdopterin biosynthesis protein MoeB n=1 Tax=Pontibacillus litoralis JSM 072002 TaxID=1385512 RepID=A0A0A5FYV2_9BACI|nr:MoeB/ThiF family adenylyltransferase [Pontibacillus litoralis]KGX84984.1 thiamine/molybdopterin biosynthesis protein MoeB [Pontibacillus litoralis JSM 072002]